MTIPDSLRPAFERAMRENNAAAWDALHMACCCHAYPQPAFTPEWESHYDAVSYLSRLSIANYRARLLARAFAPPVPSAFDAMPDSDASF